MVPRVKTKTIQQRDGGLRASPAEFSLEAPKAPQVPLTSTHQIKPGQEAH